MTVLVSDSFNRANSTTSLGTTNSYNGGSSLAWQNLVGTWGITNNQAYNAGNAANAVSVVDAGVSDCKVSVTVSAYSSVWKFIARASNGTNFLCVTGTALSKVTNGSFSSLGTIPAFTTGDVLTFVLNGSSITIQKNGTTVLTVTNTFNQTATMYGLSSNNNTALYDNFQIEDLNTGGTTFTDGSTPFDTKQSIYQDSSLTLDTKQTIYNDSFISSDTKQVIYSDSSVSFDTIQQIQLGGVDGSVTFNTNQTLYSDSSVQFDTKQGLYSDSQAVFNTKQAYYNDSFVSFDTLQIIEKIDWVDGSVSFDTQQLITETPKVVAQEVNLTFIAENEVNLSSEIENSVSLSFTI
jgi:hypothetical protein